MAYENFKPLVVSAYVQTEVEKKTILVDSCYQEFDGEIEKGGRVKIAGIGDVTIGDYTGASIGSPEELSDTSIYLDLDYAKFYNFMVKDIDKAQVQGRMQKFMQKAVNKMAEERDSAVAKLAANAPFKSNSTAITSAATAKAAIDAAILSLHNNDVAMSTEVVIEVPWMLYDKLYDSLIELDTDNSKLLRNGKVLGYKGCIVNPINNLYSDGTDTYAMVRTKTAIAFASGITETEAYRVPDNFSDAVKGLNVYGCKIIAPKELYVIKVH